MPATTPPSAAEDPEDLLCLYLRDRAVHPYGIADVEQLWEISRWWLDGEAAVGLMDLAGSPVPVVYAVAARAEQQTLALLERLTPVLPDRFVATGPSGMTARLAEHYQALWSGGYRKMHLSSPDRLPPPDPRVAVLGRQDQDALMRLYATDPLAGDFFHGGLLDTGQYVGCWQDGALIASAGIHVYSRRYGVAAIANVATHPRHRRRGLATAVVGTLSHRLRAHVAVVGLNVRERNTPARMLYERLGFATVAVYEEAEYVRRRAENTCGSSQRR